MRASHIVWPIVITIVIGACSSASPAASAPPPSQQPPATAPSARSQEPASEPTVQKLTATADVATKAPAGSILMVMTLAGGAPRFEPDQVSVKAGTAVFFMKNVPGKEAPDHNMQIGPADTKFFADGSVRADQVLASTPHVVANQAMTFTVSNLQPGTYRFWCSVDEGGGGGTTHAADGMIGTLVVTP